ncbi:hypothetical protein [Chondromyces crocatus]|uniref:Uncharacterized protein n=1 Tax=Chondromyces crocatus TaxID=52 RepID=A0A0K1EFD2_CHOCO|nr:hypothetical protein [Chondromyces crocatus]AKT39566.1 uncharacterized protein CMC5_037130 [Chondromyces crocatus]
MTLHVDNARLLEELELFLVATPENRAHFDLQPFGLQPARDGIIDPLRREASSFLDLLSALDAATFGPEGMPMPRWVFYDAAELPGGIVGLGKRADALPRKVAEHLQIPTGYAGLVPLSMYVAIPTLTPGTWVGHNLCSLRDLSADDALRGIGRLTKAVALKVFNARRQIGVTQWNSRALRLHARMGPLRLLTAWTPAHTYPASLTYEVTVDDRALRHLAGEPGNALPSPPPERWVDGEDNGALEALQARIEAGEHLWVTGLPELLPAGRQRIPIARLPRP